jgi:acyl carrier protein
VDEVQFEKLTQAIREVLQNDEATVGPETRFVDDLEADSIDVIEVVSILEGEFDITVDEEQVYEVQTVGDLADLIARTIQAS